MDDKHEQRRNEMSYSMAILRDDEIISELKDGNYAKGSTAFVRKHQNFVYNTALRYLNSVEDAEDISQEVFVKALESIDNFRGESSIKTWLYRITKNFCLNQLRKKKINTIFSFSSVEDDETDNRFKDENLLPDENMQNSELTKSFLAAVNKLPQKQRETFALRYFEDMPYGEISEILGTSVGGLKANYYQAVKKLAVELQEFKN